MSVTSLLCGPRADLWPFYGFLCKRFSLFLKVLHREKTVFLCYLAFNMTLFCHRPQASKLHVMVGDVLRTDLPYFDVCVANLPYQVRSDLFIIHLQA